MTWGPGVLGGDDKRGASPSGPRSRKAALLPGNVCFSGSSVSFIRGWPPTDTSCGDRVLRDLPPMARPPGPRPRLHLVDAAQRRLARAGDHAGADANDVHLTALEDGGGGALSSAGICRPRDPQPPPEPHPPHPTSWASWASSSSPMLLLTAMGTACSQGAWNLCVCGGGGVPRSPDPTSCGRACPHPHRPPGLHGGGPRPELPRWEGQGPPSPPSAHPSVGAPAWACPQAQHPWPQPTGRQWSGGALGSPGLAEAGRRCPAALPRPGSPARPGPGLRPGSWEDRFCRQGQAGREAAAALPSPPGVPGPHLLTL